MVSVPPNAIESKPVTVARPVWSSERQRFLLRAGVEQRLQLRCCRAQSTALRHRQTSAALLLQPVLQVG